MTGHLIVQADDFGMCHAVNEGIVRAFTEGVVTQASVMPPCPWFGEAAALALEHGITVGMHETLTSDWDHYRWSPLTSGPSLRQADGTFWSTVPQAIEHATDDDAEAELCAQAERCAAAGLRLTYLDVHMGISKPRAYSAMAKRLGVPFLYAGIDESLTFASIGELSERPASTKHDWLMRRLDRVASQDGVHLIVAHPGVASAELSSMARADAKNRPWAEEYRVADLEVLCDPRIRARLDELGIRLTTVAEAFA